MNKNEIKKLIKRRHQLANVFKDFNSDLKEDSTTETLEAIAKNSRNDLGDVLRSIDEQLLVFVKTDPVGVWLLKIKGVTPDIAAGLLSYFNITNKECAAQFISYAGADNYNNPHNNTVRDLLNKLECNFKYEKDSLYNNLNSMKFNSLTANGMDPIVARIKADRYSRKIFISHLFEEMYREEHNGELPRRYDTEANIIEPEVPYTK